MRQAPVAHAGGMESAAILAAHCAALARCRTCPRMVGPVVAPPPVLSPVYLIGQAPGPREGALQRPFAWTAGRTLFRWFAGIGADEARVRERIYIAAVCRCFPGKAASGGDRVPAPDEIAACARWMKAELALQRPTLVIPIGRLAIAQVLGDLPLAEAVGVPRRATLHRHACDVIALPHPSGASTWWRRDPGATLLGRALALIGAHPAWREAVG